MTLERLAPRTTHRRRLTHPATLAASLLLAVSTTSGAAMSRPAWQGAGAGIPECERENEWTVSAGAIATERSDSATLALRLNLPAFRLDVLTGAVVTRSYPVAVGERRYRTPIGSFEIVRLVWNPWWYPPDAEWAKDEKITPPGPNNPMGKVKLLLRGTYYLHGTPVPASIGSAASHGCIRMHNEDAIALARLVQSVSGATISPASTDSLVARTRPTRVVDLPRPVPLEIVYVLAEVGDSAVVVHPDIYRRASSMECEILTALARAGHDTSVVDRQALRSIARRRRVAADTVALGYLFSAANSDSR
jgi:hypothetical protein